MVKHFYSHLIEAEDLFVEIKSLQISQGEKNHLISLVHANLHHIILDAVLSELSEEDKKKFLSNLSLEDHNIIWDFLKNRIEDIEDKIKKTANELKKELHKDIKEIKKK